MSDPLILRLLAMIDHVSYTAAFIFLRLAVTCFIRVLASAEPSLIAEYIINVLYFA
jgi:hypothetical protein